MPCPTPSLGSQRRALDVSRRHVLVGLGSGVLATSAACRAPVEPLTRRGTPQLTMGPFYPLDRPPEVDWDMTRLPGRPGVARGVIMELRGKTMSEAGKPVPGALLEVWQTNGLGRYHHPSDPVGLPYDPNFQGLAVIRADAQGDYRIRTVVPLPYASRQRHIHFDVSGRKRRLITQMFFPGEPNERDSLYPALKSEVLQRAVTADFLGEEAGVKQFRWNIALAGE